MPAARPSLRQLSKNGVRAGRVAAYRPVLRSIEQRGGVGEDGHKRDAGCQAEGCTAGGKDEFVHRLYPFSGLHFALLNPEPTGLYAEDHNALCASDLPSRRTHREVGLLNRSALPSAITPQPIENDRSSRRGRDWSSWITAS